MIILSAGALVILVAVTCVGITTSVLTAKRPSEPDLAQPASDIDLLPSSLDQGEDPAHGHRQPTLPSVNPPPVPSPDSDVQLQGSTAEQRRLIEARRGWSRGGVVFPDADPTADDSERVTRSSMDPPATDPAPIVPRSYGPPELLKQAYDALQRKDVAQVIAHLEECLGENPPSPYKEEVEDLLAQARVAVSPEEVKKSLVDWLNKQTDKQVQDMANTGQVRIDVNQFRIPVKNNILKEVFLKTAFGLFRTPEWAKVVSARLNRSHPQLAPRPTDPAALLAAEGLTKEGDRWALAALELELKEQLTTVMTLQKKVSSARNAVSSRQRAAVVLAQKELAQRRAAAEKEHQDAIKPGNLIEVRDQEKYLKKIAELAEAEKKINAAAEQVTQADIAADAAIEELRPELDSLEKMITSFEETQERLSNDQEVLAAIESQGGGSFATSTVLKSAKSIAVRIRKDIGGVDNF